MNNEVNVNRDFTISTAVEQKLKDVTKSFLIEVDAHCK